MPNAKAGKQLFLPPKSPFPIIPPSNATIGPKCAPRPRDGQRHHQRTASESFLIEEQPSWLDELLNEPETPVRRSAHRRSSSDSSFAYLNPASGFDTAAYYAEAGSFGMQNRVWESALNMVGYPSSLPPAKHKSECPAKEGDGLVITVAEKHGQEKSGEGLSGFLERKEGSQGMQAQSETDTKRVKQQYAQRSRVRKLQYIDELERHVQTLQNLILNLENKALKQRLDSLAQEQLIKHFQQETLEREIARLKLLYQQQQPAPTHDCSSSRDLDSQFANLSFKHREANSACDPVTVALHI